MFSLCIPTLDRFDGFLKKNIQKYLENEFISEIIISDENGNDIKRIKQYFPENNNKLKLFKNEKILGPFLNKLKCCKYSRNEWIVLLDSDNFADIDYFEISQRHILENNNNNLNKESIIAPCMASPNFDYRFLNNVILTKNNIKNYYNNPMFNTFINTGNYIINKNIIDNLCIKNELTLMKTSSACDVKFMNTLFLEQFKNLNIHVVENMKYEHCVHENSIYLQTYVRTQDTINNINDRFYRCIFS